MCLYITLWFILAVISTVGLSYIYYRHTSLFLVKDLLIFVLLSILFSPIAFLVNLVQLLIVFVFRNEKLLKFLNKPLIGAKK